MINPDKIVMSSEFPTYQDLGTVNSSVTIAGTIASGGTATFEADIVVDPGNNRCDIYAVNSISGLKQLISSTNYLAVYDFAGDEFVEFSIEQNPGLISVIFNVFNGDPGSITLITQTLQIYVVQYRIPF